ncbi:MAG: helix-turn-helix transcriptional regulator [Bacilli bacterium]|nr:helix-turn-helix transcriptional regulator [Bacilli bacterium]
MKYRIKDLREDKELLQKDIAKILNTTQQHYSRIENGDTEITGDRIKKLAQFYNTSADYILGLTNVKEPYKRIK